MDEPELLFNRTHQLYTKLRITSADLCRAISDLHGCIDVNGWDALEPETQRICLLIHTALHHPELPVE